MSWRSGRGDRARRVPQTADLFRLDVDLNFYDTTTAYFEIDDPDEGEQDWAGRLYAPLRRRGHSKEGRDNQPQVIIALAVTRDGMPVRSWVLPGDTADVSTVARIKEDLRAWRLRRCLFVGDAGMYSADNLAALSRGLGRYILAVPMRRVKDVEAEVLSRPGRYKQAADNLQVKEVWVGDGERRKRYVLCLNPQEAERERQHRAQVLVEIAAELALLEQRDADHPKAACTLLASRRYDRYLGTDARGRPKLDAAKVRPGFAVMRQTAGICRYLNCFERQISGVCLSRAVGGASSTARICLGTDMSAFQYRGQLRRDFCPLNNSPAFTAIAHRLQAAERMGDPRPGQLTADLSCPLHLQRQHTELDVRLDPARRPVKHRPHLQARLLYPPEADL